MKTVRVLFYLSVAAFFTFMISCKNSDSGNCPHEKVLFESVLEQVGPQKAGEIREALERLPHNEKRGMEFLLAYLPESDREEINLPLLLENTSYAYKAREEFPWAAAVPEDVFLNDVLPYAVVDETREMWRKEFYSLFAPKVAGLSDIRDAVRAVNSNINETLGVDYNTRRNKPNQSPGESMKLKMASCTGLAILLVDAFRSVGVPARFAGNASWHDNRGNHSWVEVWVDGEWLATEFYMPRELNRPWFLANAAKGVPGDLSYAIYATSYKCREPGIYFPMVWNRTNTDIHAEDVTMRYIEAYRVIEDKVKREGTHVPVSLRMFQQPGKTTESGDRVAVNVDVFDNNLQVDGGRTAGPLQDMNDVLTFLLEKNRTYAFRYRNAADKTTEVIITVKEEPLMADAFMEE